MANGKFHKGGNNKRDELPCAECGEIVYLNKPDPCLGYLPGIAQACCGHEGIRFAYCCGWDGCEPDEKLGDRNQPGFFLIRREEAIEYMNSLKEK